LCGSTGLKGGGKTGDRNGSGPERGWKEVMLFLAVVSIFIMTFFALIGLVLSIVYTVDSTIDWRYILGSVLFALFLILTQVVTHIMHGRCMYPIYLISSLGLALFFYLFLVSAAILLLILFLIVWGMSFHSFAGAGTVRVLVPVLISAVMLYGLLNARFLRRTRITIPFPEGEKERVRLALISDLHLGLLVGKRRLDAVAGSLKEYRPDLIIIAGDLLDTHPRNLERFEPFVRELCSTAPVLAVSGNHEFYNGYRESLEWMSSMGMTLLENRWVRDERTGLVLIGIGDPTSFGDIGRYREKLHELVESSPGGNGRILVSHQPLFFSEVAGKGVNLMLSGHTHAGQIWPFNLVTRAIFAEGDRGLHEMNGSHLYVCQGTGTWGPPMRVGTYSELVLMDLVRKD